MLIVGRTSIGRFGNLVTTDKGSVYSIGSTAYEDVEPVAFGLPRGSRLVHDKDAAILYADVSQCSPADEDDEA